jgi:hypothetical protein
LQQPGAIIGAPNQVAQLMSFTASKLSRLHQLHPIKGRPVATAVLAPLPHSADAFIEEPDYASVADQAGE